MEKDTGDVGKSLNPTFVNKRGRSSVHFSDEIIVLTTPHFKHNVTPQSRAESLVDHPTKTSNLRTMRKDDFMSHGTNAEALLRRTDPSRPWIHFLP